MTIFWAIVGLLALTAALRHRARRERYTARAVGVDDDAIRDIIERGSVTVPDDDPPLDEREVARAEREFWDEYGTDPEEYGR